MKSHEIREKFLKYFEDHGHTRVPSSSLVPQGDKTLLFNNAGMNQFKNTFLGLEKREYTKATSSQKCVRAGGKHNDLEQVGHTARHHTFFEMLGNFSFGNYFKKEAIHYAWDFLTNVLQIPKDKLYVTVFTDDDEAAEIWEKQENVPQNRIFRFGEKDNFWRMGDTGPCGPCSEIFFDHGPSAGKEDASFGEDDDRYVEIWNLVFMQFNEDENKNLNPLPNPSIDTGAGLERLAAVMQGKTNNFDTDCFSYLIKKAQEIAKAKDTQENLVAMRVLSDHARTTAFLIADGVLPSNEGRGYVLRRIMRRAIRYGRKLSENTSLLSPLVEEVIDNISKIYPELKKHKKLIAKTTVNEENAFLASLDKGSQEFEKALQNISGKIVPGDVVFKLYDTYGFPLDLTKIMAEEKNMTIDENGFEQCLEEARKLSQSSWKGTAIGGDEAHLIELGQKAKATKFTGYETLTGQCKVQILSNGSKQVDEIASEHSGLFICGETPFYAEGGGQVGDQGIMKWDGGEANIVGCIKRNNVHIHQVEVLSGTLKVGAKINFYVNESERRDIANNHSATHLMHAALRQVLGEHVTQAGSLVEPDRLRFDFTHDQPVTDKEIQQIEKLVNDQISLNIPTKTEIMKYDKALEAGALALFGEKYEDKVRVLKIGFSTELCGGTHVANTGLIRLFKIISETGVSSGVRRIEALTGEKAVDFLLKESQLLHAVQKEVGGSKEQLSTNIQRLKSDNKNLVKELQKAKGNALSIDDLLKEAQEFGDGKYLAVQVDVDDRKVLSDITDKLRNKLQHGVVLVAGNGENGHPIIVSVTKDLSDKYKAGNILKEVAQVLGGKGGGRPDFAQGSAPSLKEFDKAKSTLKSLLNN